MRRTLTVLGVTALAAGAAGLLARYLPISNHALLGAAVISPYLGLASFAAVVFLPLARRKVISAIAVATAIATVAVQLPLYMSDQYDPRSIRIRVMTVNLFLGQADPQAVVDRAKAGADIVAVQELTRRAARQLTAAGLDRAFPFRTLEARPEASGTGLWSRYPISDVQSYQQYTHATLSARIHVDGLATDPTVFVAHIQSPWPESVDAWNREIADVQPLLQRLAKDAGTACVIAAGDFNDTLDTRNFRRVLSGGYRDAAEQSGAGITATYPANVRLPPLVAIDHVLTNRCSASSAKTAKITGSDHRALLVRVEAPES